ncbi:sigma-70 family RNA polymerase sigma factor [Roseomonas sp. KE0001]|uniref:sigma-70 family RNA polymerase sigma factor n=1 Tax=Roseomonas sp. KE0001 TaxID=2479201 RepID=UPI0018DFFDD0|nr:sigma-70 family RNA polymerase sigma factor [Roseomonas sp. KE0001]MBI0436076.1 sigma-70 family RNA polymerase sigma factor [Roseomonas sp. KE0001]
MSKEASLSTLFRLTLASGVPAAVSFHLKRGAPLNGQDGKGRTPLILAAMRGHAEVCRLLLEAGADAATRDADGRDALAAAQAAGHSPVVALIAGYWSADAVSASEQALPPEVDRREPYQECTATPEPPDAPRFPLEDDGLCPGNRPEGDTAPTATLLALDTAAARMDLAETAEDDAGAELADGWVADDGEQTAAPSADEGSEVEPVASQGMVAAPPILAEPPSPAAGSSTADQLWEPEPEPLLLMSAIDIERAAAALDAQLTSHAASTTDQDWADTDLDLPGTAPAWVAMFVEGFDGHRAVVRLLEAALRHGWVSEGALDELAMHAATRNKEEAVTTALRTALGDLGVLVEREHALDLSRDADDDSATGSSSLHRSDIADTLELLDGMAGALPDAESLLLEEAARARIPSASEEVRLFRELASARRDLLKLTASSASIPATLRSWADRLDAGLLVSRDVSDADWTAAQEDVDDASNRSSEEEGSVAKGLAASLREAARRDADAGDAERILSAMALTTRRLLELAEGALPPGRRSAPRRRTAPEHISENTLQGVHLLRRASTSVQASGSAATVESVLERYLVLREMIVKANLRRIVWHARRYARPAVPFLDLVQEGQIGLLRAIDKYDVERGWRFGTYATWWIRQSMSRCVQDTGQTVRIPVHLLERMAKTRRHADAFRVKHGFKPSSLDLAQVTELDVRAVERALAAEREVMPLEEAAGLSAAADHEPGLTREACVPELVDPETPLATVLQNDLRLALLDALQKLDQRAARILDLRFGITDGHPLTLEEVGQSYRVTRERIRQIEAKALDRLPRHLPSRHFESMVP